MPDWAEQAVAVEPVDPAQGGHFLGRCGTGSAAVNRLIEGIQNEVRRGAEADLPVDDAPVIGIDHQGDVDQPGPGMMAA